MDSEPISSSRGSIINQDFCDIIIEHFKRFLGVYLEKGYRLGYVYKKDKKGVRKKVKHRFRVLAGRINKKTILVLARNRKYSLDNDAVPLEIFKGVDIKFLISASWLSKKTNRRCLDNDISVDVSCMQYIKEHRKNVDAQSYRRATRAFRHEYAWERGLDLEDIKDLDMPYYRLASQSTDDKTVLFRRWNFNLKKDRRDRTRGHKHPSIYNILDVACGLVEFKDGIPLYDMNKDDYKLKTLYWSANDPPGERGIHN